MWTYLKWSAINLTDGVVPAVVFTALKTQQEHKLHGQKLQFSVVC